MNIFYTIIIIVVLVIVLSFIWTRLSRNMWASYDPLYKTWFANDDLDDEQISRIIPGSNRLAEPDKFTKRRPPYWKETCSFKQKIKRYIFYGNKPRPIR